MLMAYSTQSYANEVNLNFCYSIYLQLDVGFARKYTQCCQAIYIWMDGTSYIVNILMVS